MNLTIAVPTCDNLQQLSDTLISLVRNTDFQGKLLVIDNGLKSTPETYKYIQGQVPYDIDWYDALGNLGWAKAINLAISKTKTEFFCMLNDDVIFVPDRDFWRKLMAWFNYGEDMRSAKVPIWHEPFPPWFNIGGVGPISNYAFGYQNLWMHGVPDAFLAPVLIGFCAVYRTELVQEGLDAELPGGDDFDLSIRTRWKGYGLVVDRRCYLHHIGSQTGGRLKPDYWDSAIHQADVYNAIIRKHGLKKWYSCINCTIQGLDGGWFRHPDVPSIDNLYERVRTDLSDVRDHVETIRTFAECCQHITEFGVDDGTTTTIFLAAKPKKLISYDLVRKPEVDKLIQAADGTEFIFKQQDTLAEEIEDTDLLFIDDKHTYSHVREELSRHAGKVKQYILLHDTESFGRHGEDGEQRGVKTAALEFLKEHPEWTMVVMRMTSNGLIALARIKQETTYEFSDYER